MSEEIDPIVKVSSTAKKALKAMSDNNEVLSQMLLAHQSMQNYMSATKAIQALLDMSRFVNPIIDTSAQSSLRASIEHSANLAAASNQLAAQAAALQSERFALFSNVSQTFEALNEANQRLLDALPKFDISLLLGIPKSYPPNWTKDFDLEILEEIIYRDGIPVVWVPDSRILDAIVIASDREARILILMEASEVVLEDCLRIIGDSENVELVGLKPLAIKSINAWAAHPEASQALAVVVADSLITKWLPKITSAQKYSEMAESVKRPLAEVPIVKVRQAFALAVIYSFYTKFNSASLEARPSALSRHVTVHDANIDHFHRENALIAIMVMSSLIRTFNDLI